METNSDWWSSLGFKVVIVFVLFEIIRLDTKLRDQSVWIPELNIVKTKGL